MKYISTQNPNPATNDAVDFKSCILNGLAPDGGLYVPTSIPLLDPTLIHSFAQKSFQEIAFDVTKPFIGDSIPDADLKGICAISWAGFSDKDITPLRPINVENGDTAQDQVLELYHGPTLAFKDVALQFLARLFDYFKPAATIGDQKLTIIGATSGDTGAAAIEAFRHLPHVDIFILHPNGGVSDIQRRMMTSVADKNVHNIALDGNFDDCQNIVKALFVDDALTSTITTASINSINWGRILAQVIYYFYAVSRLPVADQESGAFNFVVPTGNFGDIFAGFIAQKMGLNMGKLVIANNDNDILTRTYKSGVYEPLGMSATLAPAMDIQIASNFERLVYFIGGKDTAIAMKQALANKQAFKLPSDFMHDFRMAFVADAANDAQIKAAMINTQVNHRRTVDPHTATALHVISTHRDQSRLMEKCIILSTAHPVKFAESVTDILVTSGHLQNAPALPDHFADLLDRPEYMTNLANNSEDVKSFILNALNT